MKKLLLTVVAITAALTSAYAQSYKMTITLQDGTTQELVTSDVKQITYSKLEDKNADQVIFKEIYNGGCLKNDGKSFQFDKSFVLYNNCGEQAVLNNLCFGVLSPSNGHSQNKWYDDSGSLIYDTTDGYLPCWSAIWWFPNTLTIEPYSQVVVNVNGAIDNTQTVSNSVNYANKDYYCMYDPESGYYNTNYYPTPSALIPSSHYLKAVIMGLGNGWPFSMSSPAFVVFQTPEGTNPREYCTNSENLWYSGGDVKQVNACAKVPNEWIVDAMEVFSSDYKEGSLKRLTADIDAGYVWLTNRHGHTLYRNVDQQATEALEENAGKLVYNYQLGVDDSTDPSGIDAEASLKNGAHIIYQDTNNSTNDFHERQTCSLKE